MLLIDELIKPVLPLDQEVHAPRAVLLANGDGTFQPAVNYNVGIGPLSVAAGDFNADGKPDLAIANVGPLENNTYTGGDVSVLLGKGDGTFRASVTYNAGIGPSSVSVGDFNGDGRSDLFVVNKAGVSVLLGVGDGTFQSAVNFGAGSEPASAAVADFNRDGKPDLAVTSSFFLGAVSVLLNTCGIDLAIARSNSTNAVVSWPFASAGFVLESTTNLSLTNWQRAVETPATNNARLEITVSADQQQRYFRLHKP